MKNLIFFIFTIVFMFSGCLDRATGGDNNSNKDECTSQADCEVGEFCDPNTLKCELLNACDCKENEICEPVNKKCIEYEANLCKPCVNHGDCGIDLCMALGDKKYCSSFCDENHSCPNGFDCTDIKDAAGNATGLTQCIPIDNNQCEAANKCALVDCNTNQYCDENTGKCKDKVCESNADCFNGQECNENGYCVPVTEGCTTKDDCATNEFCNQNTHKCQEIKGCQSDSDCDEPLVCNLQLNKCVPKTVECNSDYECDEGMICNQQYHKCVLEQVECRTDTDCGLGMTCDLTYNKCVPVDENCYSDEDCGFGQYCDMNTNTCEYGQSEGCTDDSECSDGLTCQFGYCTGCTDDSDCPSDQTCQDLMGFIKYCAADNGNGTQRCFSNDQCDQDQSCDFVSGDCYFTDGHCDTADDCKEGMDCQSMFGQSACKGCEADGDCFMGQTCLAGMCLANNGGNTCETNDDCFIPGQFCLNGQCIGTGGGDIPTP